MIDISIITPTYNRIGLLRRTITTAVEGISSQKDSFERYISSLQWIIVNDDPRIDLRDTPIMEVINHDFIDFEIINNADNLGLAGARNVGLGAVKNNYLVLLDDDDIILPSYWKYIVKEINNDNKHNFWYNEKAMRYYNRYPGAFETRGYYAGGYNDTRMLNSNFLSCMQVTCKMELCVNRRFDESLKFNEDWDWWGQILYNENHDHPKAKVKYIPIIGHLYTMRVNSDINLSRNGDPELLATISEVRSRNRRRYENERRLSGSLGK